MNNVEFFVDVLFDYFFTESIDIKEKLEENLGDYKRILINALNECKTSAANQVRNCTNDYRNSIEKVEKLIKTIKEKYENVRFNLQDYGSLIKNYNLNDDLTSRVFYYVYLLNEGINESNNSGVIKLNDNNQLIRDREIFLASASRYIKNNYEFFLLIKMFNSIIELIIDIHISVKDSAFNDSFFDLITSFLKDSINHHLSSFVSRNYLITVEIKYDLKPISKFFSQVSGYSVEFGGRITDDMMLKFVNDFIDNNIYSVYNKKFLINPSGLHKNLRGIDRVSYFFKCITVDKLSPIIFDQVKNKFISSYEEHYMNLIRSLVFSKNLDAIKKIISDDSEMMRKSSIKINIGGFIESNFNQITDLISKLQDNIFLVNNIQEVICSEIPKFNKHIKGLVGD